jgi:fatty-acyl-CoA synthase
MDLAHWIERHARFTPRSVALRFGASAITYAELGERVARAAGALGKFLKRGEVLAYLGLNHPAMLELLFACARTGAVFLPLNWRHAAPEHARTLLDAQPRVVVAQRQFAGLLPESSRVVLLEEWEAIDPDPVPPRASGDETPVLLCYTSGATGAPKGVLLTQRALLWNAVNSTHMHDLTSADRVLTTLPLFHVGGLNILTLPALHAGASVTLHEKFDPAATLAAVEAERITLTVLVPAQLMALMEAPRWREAELSSLRMITTGSTIVGEAFVRKVNARGVPLVQVYGSTETAPVASYVRREDAARKAGSAGVPALHCEVRVVDDAGRELAQERNGEIEVRGPNVMLGYWRSPEATAEALHDGWFRSGDVGHFDAEGHLHVVSRKKDMIISGGENIYPAELETILLECPQIEEACVVGRPDERWGEAVVAAVVLKKGGVLSARQVMDLFENRIARYKHPREVRFVPALPRTALGKVKKDDVRALWTSS